MHSFSLTDHTIILAEYPCLIDVQSLGENPKKSFLSHLRWNPAGNTVFTIIERGSGRVVSRCTTGPFFSWHHVNAYETEEGVVVDLITANPPTGERALKSLKRFYLDLDTHSVKEETLFEGVLEMPWIREELNGRPYRFMYGIDDSGPARGRVHPLYKVDVQSRTVQSWSEPGCYPGEPVFVPSPENLSEDDGLILSLVLDDKRKSSFLLILDATTMNEVARAWLPHHIPRGLHGAFFH